VDGPKVQGNARNDAQTESVHTENFVGTIQICTSIDTVSTSLFRVNELIQKSSLNYLQYTGGSS
jgi:hypothetical protein